MVLSHLRRGAMAGIGLVLALALVPVASTPVAHAAGSTSKLAKLRAGMWRPDGTVLAIAVHGSRIYVAGDFTQMIGPEGQQARRLRIAALNRRTGALVNGFHPRVNGTVKSLAVFDHKLFLGGYFTKVNGRSRHHLVALGTSRGHLVKPWKAQVDGPVFSLLHMGKRLYAGGDFTTVAKTHRVRLFALNRARHVVTSWPAVPRGANGPVFTLAAAPGHHAVIVGGHFHDLVDRSRVNLGAVAVGGRATGWTPAAVCTTRCPVRDLAVGPGTVYAGIDGPGGRARAYRWSSGRTVWNLKTDGEVDAVSLAGDELLLGGHFTKVGGQDHPMFAAVDAASGTVQDRTVTTSGSLFPGVLEIHIIRGIALVGGAFDDLAGQRRLAAIRS